MHDPAFRPKLRRGLKVAPADGDDVLALFDSRRLSSAMLQLSRFGARLADLCDGTRTVPQIHAEAVSLLGDTALPFEQIAGLIAALDDALFLESPAFQAYVNGPSRRPSCIGCYPSEPDAIREQLHELFTAPGGPGLPSPRHTASPPGTLRAALLPHMDFARGGVTYGWGFKELIEQTDARLFVIVATSHYSPHRFTLTRMNFETPLGTVETDRDYVNRIAANYGPEVFDDPFAHLPEHSIELEVILLQYLLEDRPFRIVPLLVGSFSDCVDTASRPEDQPDISRMVDALRAAEVGTEEPICYLISGDLAHIGPKFGDPAPVGEPWLTTSRSQDERILNRLENADADGYFGVIAAEGNERRICGLAPTWLTLAAAQPRSGKVLHYGRYVHPRGNESVSFAAAAFYE